MIFIFMILSAVLMVIFLVLGEINVREHRPNWLLDKVFNYFIWGCFSLFMFFFLYGSVKTVNKINENKKKCERSL